MVMSGFPFSDWGLMALATAHYNLRHFDESEELFETLLSRDPHRIEACLLSPSPAPSITLL